MNRSTAERPGRSANCIISATSRCKSNVRRSSARPVILCIWHLTDHRKFSAFLKRLYSSAVSRPTCTSSDAAGTLWTYFPIQYSVCRSRSPPLPSLTFGSTTYRLSPMRLCRSSRSAIFKRTKSGAVLPTTSFQKRSDASSYTPRSPHTNLLSSKAVRMVKSSCAIFTVSSKDLLDWPTFRPRSHNK